LTIHTFGDYANFLDFNVNPDFKNCIDGLAILDLHKLKEKKESDI